MRKLIYILTFIFLLCFSYSCNKDVGTDEIRFDYEKTGLPEEIMIRSISFLNQDHGLLCGGRTNSNGSIYITTNRGINWERVFHSDSLSVNDLKFINDTLVYACGDDNMLLISGNKGREWNIRTLENPYFNYGVSYNEIYASGHDNFFLAGGRRFDEGLISECENIQWIHSGFYNRLNTVCFVTDYVGFFGGEDILMKTIDGGNTFSIIETPNTNVVDIEKDINGNLYVLFDNGVVSMTSDFGYYWTNVITDRYSMFTDSYFSDNMGAICGKRGTLYVKYTQAGWIPVQDLPDVNFESVYVNNRNEIFLGTDRGEVYVLNRNRLP